MSVGANPRNSNGHQRRKLKARVRSLGLPCALCGRPIDYTLSPGDPWCYELDEIHPVSRWEEFGYASKQAAALDPRNVQPAHRYCNQRKSNKTGTEAKRRVARRQPLKQSADW